jgi:hypothetical protein
MDASVWVCTVVPSTFTSRVAVNGELTSLLRYQYVKIAVPAGMVLAWDRLAVWLDVPVWPPNLAQATPVRGTEVPPTFEQTDVVHKGVPRTESASLQEGLFAGSPVAASKPPSWMSSAAAAGPVRNGATTSPDATRIVAHHADRRGRAELNITKWPPTMPAEIDETSRDKCFAPLSAEP